MEKIQYPDTTLSDSSVQTNCIYAFKYDGHGQMVEMRSPEGRKTTLCYYLMGNGAGLVKTITQHDTDAPLVKHFEYDALGNVAKVIDGEANAVVTLYNLLGQLVSTTLPVVNGSSAVFKVEYDEDRLPKRHYLSRGSYADTVLTGNWITNEFTYDSVSQLTKVVHFANTANPTTESYVRDHFGNIVTQTDAIGRITRYKYDERGLVLEQVAQAQSESPLTTRYRYDLAGRVTRVIEPDQNQKQFTYDSFGRLKSIIDPIGNTAVYSYGTGTDDFTKIEYFKSSDVTAVPFKTFEYDYDEKNRLRAGAVNGLNTKYLYDCDDLATSVEDQTGAATTAAYDGVGRLCKIVDEIGNVHQTEYDLRGNVKRSRNVFVSSSGADVSLEKNIIYDVLNRPIAVGDQGGNSVGYAYDGRSLPIEVTDALGHKVGLSYDLNREVVRAAIKQSGGTERVLNIWHRDAAGRLIAIEDAEGALASSVVVEFSAVSARRAECPITWSPARA